MTSKEIQALLENQAKKKPSTLAHSIGVSRALMTNALKGKGTRRARLKIARTLSIPPSAIWPDVPREQMVVDNDAFYNPEFYEL